MKLLKIFESYLALFRIDVAIISFISYIIASDVSGNLNFNDVIVALLFTLFSMNFIYSINSWSDWKIDKINKPFRPIPSGRIKPKQALIYCMFLLAGSIIFPFFVYNSLLTLLLFLLMPVIGVLYSVRPFRFKENIILSVISTSLILVIPSIVGYWINDGATHNNTFFIGLFIFLFSVIPIKDIEDIKGDSAYNSQNWLHILGEKKLMILSLIGLSMNSILMILTGIDKFLKVFMIVISVSTILTVVFFIRSRLKLSLLYRTIIVISIFEAFALYAFLNN